MVNDFGLTERLNLTLTTDSTRAICKPISAQGSRIINLLFEVLHWISPYLRIPENTNVSSIIDWNVYPAPAKIRQLFKDSVLTFRGTKRVGRNFDLRDKVKKILQNNNITISIGSRDSSVGIATHYGLDGPGIASGWGRDFPHLSRPGLGPTQSPVQWVPDVSRR